VSNSTLTTSATAAAFFVAASLLIPTNVAARGMRAHHTHAFHHHAFWPYGGIVTYPLGWYEEPVSAMPMAIDAATTQTHHCTPSRETITVRSEDGGERQITIRRC
jgi:hypothetical protein